MTKKNYILIIDDEPFIRRLFGAKLSNAGFEILYAPDGNAGREMARQFQPDLILLDIRMPGTDGYLTAKRLKSEKRTKNIPIVFLTNVDFSLEAEKAMRDLLGVDYIHKSIDLNAFVERIKKICQLHNKRQQNKTIV